MSLEKQRQQTSQAIADLLQKTFFRRYWRAIGTFIGRGRVAPIWVSAAVVMLVNLLVGTTVSALLGETRFTAPEIILTNLMWVTYTYFTIPLALGGHSSLVDFLRVRLVETMEAEQNIQELQAWAEQWLGRMFPQLLFTIGFALIAAPLGFYAIYHTTHFSLGVTLIYFINLFHLFASIYGLISLLAFLLKLRNWRLRLYPDDPASSPILMQLSEELRNYILGISFWFAIFMLLMGLVGALNTITILMVSVFNWIPSLTLFVLGNYVFTRLITRIKHERLERLQSEIMKLSGLGKFDTRTTAQIMSLMDYHDRVKASRNSLINLQSILNLVGSLALPLLATLIQAWPYIQNLFK